MLASLRRIAVTILAGTLLAAAVSATLVGTLHVWVDDAHTRKTEVQEVDPDDIADPSSLGLGFTQGVSGLLGVSIGISREWGVQYDETCTALIEKIHDLCDEFNEGDMSLETYQRRMREIYASVDQAHTAKLEVRAGVALQAAEAGAKLDAALGLPERDIDGFKSAIDDALAAFRGDVESVPQKPAPADGIAPLVDTSAAKTSEISKQAVAQRLAEFERGVKRGSSVPSDVELVEIWADRAHTRRIAVPKLDVERLTTGFEESLCVKLSYSTPVYGLCIGPDVTWTLDRSVEYTQAAQLLVVKYRRLCLEYNSGLVSQDEYADRLLELFEAERRAFSVREEMARRMDEKAGALRSEMQRLIGSEPTETESALDKLRREKGQAARRQLDERQRPAVLEEWSREHRTDMEAWSQFTEGVEAVHVQPPADAITVWVDDAQTRKVEVPRLDTDLIADNVVTRLSLQICFFDFGPECSWAQRTGERYGEVAQLLVLKSKQLCADYNAGLVSQEGYQRRREAIDAAVERAATVRERMVDFVHAFKQTARDKLEWYLDVERQRGEPRDG